MKKQRLTGILLALMLLSGCGANTGTDRNKEASVETTTEAVSIAAEEGREREAKTYIFIDDDGTEVSFEKPFERIVCLYSAHTENLYTLGAGERIIGGHSTAVYPPEAAFLPVYDYNGDVESLIAAEPDLVLIRPFISRRVPEYVEQIRQSGVMVVSLYPDTYEEFPEYIRKLAMLSGTQEEAEHQLLLLEENLKGITDKTADAWPKQTVFFESTETNIRTVTDDSMPGLAISMAGGISLAAGAEPSAEGSSIAEFGVENVLKHAEDIDVYVSQRGAMNAGGSLQSIDERPGYEAIKAVQVGRVYLINEKLISSPTFRYYKGVREMARFLYPELIDDLSTYDNQQKATKRDFANIVVRAAHIPVYIPSSSKYYQTEQKGHTYGLFEDISWQDEDFDYIETAVHAGYVEWENVNGKEYFYPEQTVTREELARALFVIGSFPNQDIHKEISDLEETKHPRIIQILADNEVFELEDGAFFPKQEVTNQEVIQAFSKLHEMNR